MHILLPFGIVFINYELGLIKLSSMINERAVILGEYISSTGATVRETAKKFHMSKSTVHKDVTQRLLYENPQLFETVKVVLERNKEERHIRGGMATRRKYRELAKQE